jgi:hypothetical protein
MRSAALSASSHKGNSGRRAKRPKSQPREPRPREPRQRSSRCRSAARPAAARPDPRELLAFAAIYLLWGATFLAIRVAVVELPPFLTAGVRFLVAGALLYLWMRLRGQPAPTPVEWRGIAITSLVAGEELTPRMLIASLLVVGSVFLILTGQGNPADASAKAAAKLSAN